MASESCPLCGAMVEDTLHTLRDCTRPRRTWLILLFFLLPICNFFGIIIPLIVGYNLTCTGHRIFLLTCQNGLISLGKLSIHLGDYTTWRSLMIRLSVLNMHVILARNILDKILKLLSAWSCDVQP